jgi:aspartyl-tRNA(Asn)/glutamyl-tRNA(Gln) amidotransferase subunit A
MAPAALGTDAGGSVRIPAALCGVVGLKPTHGLVPVRGGIGFGNPTVDHIGPLTRSVEDAALLLSFMAGADPRDPTSQAAPREGDYVAAAQRGTAAPDLPGLRIGVPQNHYFESCHPEVEAAVRAAIAHLEELGAEPVPVSLPDHEALMAGMSGLGAEGLVYHGPWMRARLSDYSAPVQARLLANQFILATDYAKGLRARRLLRERYDAVLAQVNLLAAPTVPVPAPTIAEAEDDSLTPGKLPNLVQNTVPANRTGLPAISVPCGFAAGLPVGLMLMGRPFEEERLLHTAAAYEATTAWPRLAQMATARA